MTITLNRYVGHVCHSKYYLLVDINALLYIIYPFFLQVFMNEFGPKVNCIIYFTFILSNLHVPSVKTKNRNSLILNFTGS